MILTNAPVPVRFFLFVLRDTNFFLKFLLHSSKSLCNVAEIFIEQI